ncbi:hypothetical protein DUNSADRAFT_695 [Dunaliella salina]|uniref:Encoded protein n=1 Tax=Dunaliella salina TaxID=3046 RepID=A0ABQ7FYH3_DUNSA|nr:hypothetical protein DUNSADRAFT_695 [Dunaliella salina]|eukprot:KAF5827416.1 hypothetical protein DUNSADRAFT_695 [Dunaliella salina]
MSCWQHVAPNIVLFNTSKLHLVQTSVSCQKCSAGSMLHPTLYRSRVHLVLSFVPRPSVLQATCNPRRCGPFKVGFIRGHSSVHSSNSPVRIPYMLTLSLQGRGGESGNCSKLCLVLSRESRLIALQATCHPRRCAAAGVQKREKVHEEKVHTPCSSMLR